MIEGSVNRVAPFVVVAGIAWALAGGGGTSQKASRNAAASQARAPSASVNATAADPVTISSARVSSLGTVLVDGSGHTLYIFEPDNRTKVTCTKTCVAVWPPVIVNSGQKPTASGAVKQSSLGRDPNPNPSGGRVVTYDGWPLYTYAGDTRAGEAKGQALDVNGGLWYAISPAGKVIKKKP